MAATLDVPSRTLFFEGGSIEAGANARIVRTAPRAHVFARSNIRSQPDRVASLFDQQAGTRDAVHGPMAARAQVCVTALTR
jgi:hypothetical protein